MRDRMHLLQHSYKRWKYLENSLSVIVVSSAVVFFWMSVIVSNHQPFDLNFNFGYINKSCGVRPRKYGGDWIVESHFWLEKSLHLSLCELAHHHSKATSVSPIQVCGNYWTLWILYAYAVKLPSFWELVGSLLQVYCAVVFGLDIIFSPLLGSSSTASLPLWKCLNHWNVCAQDRNLSP
jgi:hypothetical protein